MFPIIYLVIYLFIQIKEDTFNSDYINVLSVWVWLFLVQKHRTQFYENAFTVKLVELV